MDNEKKLSMMRFWLVGTVVIVITMVSVAAFFLTEAMGNLADNPGQGMTVFSLPEYWMTVAIAVVLSVVWYFIYKAILDRQE
ncbi:MAG: hypothetical protein IH859_07055 [Chloroflexi bacterium]|nr:hypothetical protein [Chloroflexota bacterium]